MKLRTRLALSFLILIILPVVLMAILGTFAVHTQMDTLRKVYGVEGDPSILTGASFRILTQITSTLEDQVSEEIKNDPDQFLDEDYLVALNDRFLDRNAYMVLFYDGEYNFIGKKGISMNAIHAAVIDHSLDMYEYAEEYRQVYSSADITFSDGKKGELYVFTSTDRMIPEMKNFLIEIVILTVTILVFTAIVMVIIIYRSIVRPIGELRIAAQNIRDGNLDFDIPVSKDEMGQLAADFNEMRIRLKESAEEKLEYDAENKQLISNISHDLKTPITAIKGYVEGIMDGVADTPEKVQKYIRTIYNKSNDMDRLIDELTLYSKIDTNRIPYNFVKLSITEYFEDCSIEIATELESKGIDYGFFNYLQKDETVIVDPEQFRRVINNVISNSVKYMDKTRGLINIRLNDEEDFVHIEIEDNGRGISQKDLPQIFDRFYRADTSRNTSQGGSGIGLAIVKKIVEDHGGRIYATSREGTGTVMHILLRKYHKPEDEAIKTDGNSHKDKGEKK